MFTNKRWRIVTGSIAALAVIGLSYPLFFPLKTIPVTVREEPIQRLSVPVRIRIPAIGVDSEIEQVTVASDGTMDVPKHQFNTAWYSPGARPGEVGSAVIVGHVDWVLSKRAVFTDLYRLKSGDKISVLNQDGVDISFVVRSSKTYDANQDATNVFTSTDGLAHLNLITCVGAWDRSANTYTQRLVVFTDKE